MSRPMSLCTSRRRGAARELDRTWPKARRGRLGPDEPAPTSTSCEHKGEQVVGVLDSALVQLAGDRKIAR